MDNNGTLRKGDRTKSVSLQRPASREKMERAGLVEPSEQKRQTESADAVMNGGPPTKALPAPPGYAKKKIKKSRSSKSSKKRKGRNLEKKTPPKTKNQKPKKREFFTFFFFFFVANPFRHCLLETLHVQASHSPKALHQFRPKKRPAADLRHCLPRTTEPKTKRTFSKNKKSHNEFFESLQNKNFYFFDLPKNYVFFFFFVSLSKIRLFQ